MSIGNQHGTKPHRATRKSPETVPEPPEATCHCLHMSPWLAVAKLPVETCGLWPAVATYGWKRSRSILAHPRPSPPIPAHPMDSYGEPSTAMEMQYKLRQWLPGGRRDSERSPIDIRSFCMSISISISTWVGVVVASTWVNKRQTLLDLNRCSLHVCR